MTNKRRRSPKSEIEGRKPNEIHREQGEKGILRGMANAFADAFAIIESAKRQGAAALQDASALFKSASEMPKNAAAWGHAAYRAFERPEWGCFRPKAPPGAGSVLI